MGLGAAVAILLGGCTSGDGSAGTAPPAGSGTATPAPPASSTSGSGPAASQPTVVEQIGADLQVPWSTVFLPDGTAVISERETALLRTIAPGAAGGRAGTLGKQVCRRVASQLPAHHRAERGVGARVADEDAAAQGAGVVAHDELLVDPGDRVGDHDLEPAGLVREGVAEAGHVDAEERPERPIPSGRVSPDAALAVAAGLGAAGLGVAALLGGRSAVAVGAPLALMVVAYDAVAKDAAIGPLAMASTRALNVAVQSASAPSCRSKRAPRNSASI